MNNLRKAIDEYIEKKNELNKLYKVLENELLPKLIDILVWENKNINANHDINGMGVSYDYKIIFNKEDIEFCVESWWSYGGHDIECHVMPYEKIFSDNWKEEALLNYQNKLKDKEQQKTDQERKEYERLKEKFGG